MSVNDRRNVIEKSVPHVYDVEITCELGMRRGNLEFVLNKLNELLQQGWEDLVVEIVTAQNWGLSLIDSETGCYVAQD